MNRSSRLHTTCAVLFVLLSASLTSTLAQTSKRQFEVSRKGTKVATVTTSADRDAVIVSIYRQGEPVHHFRAYPQVAVITVQVDRQSVFTYYINEGRIEARVLTARKPAQVVDESFSLKLSEVSGPERRERSDIAALRQRFADDMHILRAVRGYDPTADTLLAELAYVVLTYDDSIVDGRPSASFSINEPQVVSKVKAREALLARTSVRVTRPQDSLGDCLYRCDGQYSDCQADPGVRDKTVCHTNRTSCSNNCYSVYGGKTKPEPPAQIQP